MRIVRSKDAYILSARVREDGISDALATLLTEAERVRRHGFTASELEREKKDLLTGIAQYYADRQNIPSDNVVGFLVDNYLNEEPLTSVETDYALYNRFVPEAGLDEVNRLAAQLVTEDNRVVLVNAPAKQAAAVPSAAQVAEVFDRVARAEIAPYEDRVASRPLFSGELREAAVVSRTEASEMGITEWKLDNGITVTLKPTAFKKDEVLFGATSPGGTSLVADADYTAAVTASRIVTDSGVDGLDATSLRKLLAGKTVDVAPWIGELQEGLRGSARPEDLETLFQLIVLYMTKPGKDAEAYQVYLQRLKTSLENRASSPQSVFYDTITDLLSQHHPRGRPWGPERLREMDLDASLRVYRDRFRDAGDFHFFFVGSFTLSGIEPLARRYLGSLPSKGRVESWKDVGIRPPKGVVRREVRKGLEQQSRVELIYSGTTPWSLANSLQVEALGRVMDIRMREIVREEAGGSYDVGVDAQLDRYPTEEYVVTVGFGCAPQNVEAMTALSLREIARMREQGPDAADVAKVKEMLSREHEQSLRENGYWLGSLQMLSLNGLDPRTMLDFDKRLATISAQSLRAKAAELLKPDTYLQVVLYPEGWGEPGGKAPSTVSE
jgi:zinc protease